MLNLFRKKAEKPEEAVEEVAETKPDEKKEKPPFEWRPLFLIGGFMLVLLLGGIQAGTGKNIVAWIAGLIGFLILGRVFWPAIRLINSFERFKFVFVGVCLIALGVYVLFLFGKGMDFVSQDSSPISASIISLFFVWLGFWMTKGMSPKGANNHLMRALFLIVLSGAYVLCGGMIGKVGNSLWFQLVGIGAFGLWVTMIALKKAINYTQKNKKGNLSFKMLFKQSIWTVTTLVVPFVAPAYFLAEETKNWWEVVGILFSYVSLFYLVLVVWMGEKVKDLIQSMK